MATTANAPLLPASALDPKPNTASAATGSTQIPSKGVGVGLSRQNLAPAGFENHRMFQGTQQEVPAAQEFIPKSAVNQDLSIEKREKEQAQVLDHVIAAKGHRELFQLRDLKAYTETEDFRRLATNRFAYLAQHVHPKFNKDPRSQEAFERKSSESGKNES